MVRLSGLLFDTRFDTRGAKLVRQETRPTLSGLSPCHQAVGQEDSGPWSGPDAVLAEYLDQRDDPQAE